MNNNIDRLVSALRNVQVTTVYDNIWYLDQIIDNYNFSPLGSHSQVKMSVGSEDAAFLLQALVMAKGHESVLRGYDGGIGYYLWDNAAQVWDKVDFTTYAMH